MMKRAPSGMQLAEREARYIDYQSRLLSAAGKDKNDYRARLSDVLGFHDREAKPQWWEFFARQDRFEDELLDDAECLAGLELMAPPQTVKQSLLYTYRFPAQETKRGAGEKVTDVTSLAYAGIIEELDENRLVVSLKLGKKNPPLPERLSIGPGGPINTEVLREAIFRFTADVLSKGTAIPPYGTS